MKAQPIHQVHQSYFDFEPNNYDHFCNWDDENQFETETEIEDTLRQ